MTSPKYYKRDFDLLYCLEDEGILSITTEKHIALYDEEDYEERIDVDFYEKWRYDTRELEEEEIEELTEAEFDRLAELEFQKFLKEAMNIKQVYCDQYPEEFLRGRLWDSYKGMRDATGGLYYPYNDRTDLWTKWTPDDLCDTVEIKASKMKDAGMLTDLTDSEFEEECLEIFRKWLRSIKVDSPFSFKKGI